MYCTGRLDQHCFILLNYIDGDKLTRSAQEHYAEYHGHEMIEIRACTHCYDVEDGYPCCICDSEGWTDNPDYWERL